MDPNAVQTIALLNRMQNQNRLKSERLISPCCQLVLSLSHSLLLTTERS